MCIRAIVYMYICVYICACMCSYVYVCVIKRTYRGVMLNTNKCCNINICNIYICSLTNYGKI